MIDWPLIASVAAPVVLLYVVAFVRERRCVVQS